jgi:hypothetical protein
MGRPRIATIALLAAASVVFAAGCGDDDGDTTVTETETVATATNSGPPPGQAASGITEEGTQGPDFFSTPSKNIGCHVTAEFVRCDILKRSWEPPPDPAKKQCEQEQGLDYGHGIQLDLTHAEFVCSGDSALGSGDTLAYGEIAQRGPNVCESQPDGITCSNINNGAGFFLSKESYRIF